MALVALTENPGLVPRTHDGSQLSVLEDPAPSSNLQRHQAHAYAQAKHSYALKSINNSY